MQHHRHAGLAGTLGTDDAEPLVPHPDATHDDAVMAWFPIASPDGREIESLEGLLCVPTRPGAMRLVAVPHVVQGLALGDEVAVADWDGEPLARGELALALAGTVRVVAGTDWTWRQLAAVIHAAAAESCWFDPVGEHAVAATVPRSRLGAVFAALTRLAADHDTVRWEYATPSRHA